MIRLARCADAVVRYAACLPFAWLRDEHPDCDGECGDQNSEGERAFHSNVAMRSPSTAE
jgi:hypothetical protein